MKNIVRSLTGTLVALLCLPQLVSAQTSGSGPSNRPAVGVAIKASTFGVGLDAAVRVHSKVNLRGGFNFFSLSHDFGTDDDITYTGDLKLRSVVASVDWFPFGGGFRLSPIFVISNGNKATLSAIAAGGKTIEIGDTEYRSSSSDPVKIAGGVSFKNARPGVTIGWGNIAGGRRVTVPFELGVIFSGSPVATWSYTGTACQSNGLNCRNVATDPTLQADVKKQELEFNDELKPFRFYPVLSLGLSFRF